MKRLRAGAYVLGQYLIRYQAWLNEEWDGKREAYKPWHVYKRSSYITGRTLLDRLGSLEEARQFVAARMAQSNTEGA